MRYTACIAALLATTAFGAMAPASATDLEVTHWWTSGGEAVAAKVLADNFNKTGNHWVDGAIAGSGGVARPIIISRITGGNPMGATQMNTGRDSEDLVKAGLMTDLTELATKEGWKDFIRPSKLLDACTVDGHVYCVPVNIHSWQWMWVSPAAFKKAGLETPKNWNEFVADAPKLKEAGIIPLASGDGWQATGIFTVLSTVLGGSDLFLKINRDKDVAAAKGPEMRKIWEAFATARGLTDKGYAGRQWNEATNMVLTGKAGAQIMGDWAQGEFSLAKAVAGKDYECLPGLGLVNLLDTGGDAFYFPKNKDPEVTKAQLQLASMLVSKSVQVDFNLAKGSLPIRGDVDLAAANACMKKGIEMLKDPKAILPSNAQLLSADARGQIEDLTAEFFSNPDMTVDQGLNKYADIIANSK